MAPQIEGTPDWQRYPGATEFVGLLQSLASPGGASRNEDSAAAAAIFKWDQPLFVGRAPGRMDVMGGIADYSGALVLQMPIAEACFAAIQVERQAAEPVIQAVSPGHGGLRAAAFSMPTSKLFPAGQPLAYTEASQLFKADPDSSWAAYAVGCLLVLAREKGVVLSDCSVSILVSSTVPEGKGVSSSAAVEVSVMEALVGALGVTLSGWELAVLCQKVENHVVGAPCGIMDQMACTLGEEGRLLALLCQPATVEGTVAIPSHLQVWGIDSGVRHSVGGSDYGSVRVGAFMGLKVVRAVHEQQQQATPGTSAQGAAAAASHVGHLVHVTPSQWATGLSDQVPVTLSGSEFLATYGDHLDQITQVTATQEYAVRAPTGHPILEDSRVRLFRQLLLVAANPEQCSLLGELMFQSHASYSACKLGSPGTDRLVQMVRQHQQQAAAGGAPPLLYGAKITGGGCGGTVCILGQATAAADQVVQDIAAQYWREEGYEGSPKVFRGSSGGADSFGCLKITL